MTHHPAPASRLTVKDLRRSPYPIILHVKSNFEAEDYDHYELFLDSRADRARVINPPDAAELLPFQDLSPRWDGNGLILAARPSVGSPS